MRTRLFGTIAIAALALTACGGDDADSGPQGEVADMMIEALDEASEIEGVEGVEIDEDCIRDKVGELSDDDAQAILDAGPEGDPEVSAQADAIGESMIECVDMSGIDLGDIDSDG